MHSSLDRRLVGERLPIPMAHCLASTSQLIETGVLSVGTLRRCSTSYRLTRALWLPTRTSHAGTTPSRVDI
ncbi:hypothetical protein [Alicyclobacillus fastidiosus]|uniref:hypothetical protein n=1 Tax=Alicyclobacillus fastidiosus TaxID=392011 RepID=UPI0024E094FE|nr:hypothetical protein [Alicyclobacillus fastidiosus]